jgi:hypothetical protein
VLGADDRLHLVAELDDERLNGITKSSQAEKQPPSARIASRPW